MVELQIIKGAKIFTPELPVPVPP
ncbi:hypothetical protein METHPM2_200021 [Pseudomonas sp. PM2]